ncbi:hypothetical protein LS482_16385 [Sinomicrobium kalidii]|uniref:hypothetical protein n=1 Tax=Sinomicrobium kalidii TaxID=2900738 RepID=UPI001E460DE1|nr:hypothetical protein [Sinomicrobium kalidii]UGU15252.1 hypothetical protein LS482_16385 [Sinomicrobium kalidii]
MKKIYWFISLMLTACTAKQVVVTPPAEVIPVTSYCILGTFTKTVNYNNELEKYTDLHKDTVIEIEKGLTKNNLYTTVLDLKVASQYLWLIRENVTTHKTDSILIHCIGQTPLLLTESEFREDSCEIFKTETEFHDNGDPKVATSKIIKL